MANTIIHPKPAHLAGDSAKFHSKLVGGKAKKMKKSMKKSMKGKKGKKPMRKTMKTKSGGGNYKKNIIEVDIKNNGDCKDIAQKGLDLIEKLNKYVRYHYKPIGFIMGKNLKDIKNKSDLYQPNETQKLGKDCNCFNNFKMNRKELNKQHEIVCEIESKYNKIREETEKFLGIGNKCSDGKENTIEVFLDKCTTMQITRLQLSMEHCLNQNQNKPDRWCKFKGETKQYIPTQAKIDTVGAIDERGPSESSVIA